MTEPLILLVGASTLDTKGFARGPILVNSTNPGDIRVTAGGVARNIAENLARLGLPALLLSAVGQDQAGQQILAHTTASGVDMSHVLMSAQHSTAAYLAVRDQHGQPVVSVSSLEVTDAVTPRYLYDRRSCFRDASLLILDANLLPATLRTAFRLASRYQLPICADPTSVGPAERLLPYLSELTIVTPNQAEASVLCGHPVLARRNDGIAAARELVSKGVKIAVVTLGELGAAYATAETSGYVPAILGDVVDFTGAGDAMTAAIVFGFLEGMPADEAVRLGVAAATLTLHTTDTVCRELSLELLYDQLAV